MNITNISVSRKAVWDQCQQLYKFKYHLKIPSLVDEPKYFVYGKIIHKIAQEYVLHEGKKPIAHVSSEVLSGKIEIEKGKIAPPLDNEYKAKLPEHLRNIELFTQKTGFGGFLEYPFSYDLDPPNKRVVLGFIDRLIVQDDKFWIIDYKTTKKGWFRKGPKDIVNDLQLRCYAAVVRKNFGAKPENIKSALYYLNGAETCGAIFSKESLDLAEQELLQVYMEIESSDPDKVVGNVRDHCRSCSYAKICPAYSLI